MRYLKAFLVAVLGLPALAVMIGFERCRCFADRNSGARPNRRPS